MTSVLIQKLTGVRDLKKILETTVKELGESYQAEVCQIVLASPLDPNSTSICEYRASKDYRAEDLPQLKLPIALPGGTAGLVALTRREPCSPDEVNGLRVTLAELSDIIRHAQINDVVQRTTFRDNFLIEIGNVMSYSLGIGDALFMVVNILGKVLNASRCLFICTDDSQSGWRCYEYWQQSEVSSCRDYRWPTTDSALVSQTLLSDSPLIIVEGQLNSYVTPVQEELQFIGARSYLGLPLRSEAATHGCVILHQCDFRRGWTRQEIDMVQNVADKVAEALLKLPVEKRVREPIMQLHQRILAGTEEALGSSDAQTIQAVRRSLKEALGQQAIPSAQKTSHTAPPAAKRETPPAAEKTVTQNADSFAPPPLVSGSSPTQDFTPASPTTPTDVPPATQVASQPETNSPEATKPAGKSLSNILGSIRQKSPSPSSKNLIDFGAPTESSAPGIPGAESVEPASNLAGGNLPEASGKLEQILGHIPAAESAGTPADLDEYAVPNAQEFNPALTGQSDLLPQTTQIPEQPTSASHAPTSPQSDLNLGAQQPSSPLSKSLGGASSQWGNLDEIPTPAAGAAKVGLGNILGKPRLTNTSSPLMASLHRDKSKFMPGQVEETVQPNAAQNDLVSVNTGSAPSVEAPAYVEGPPVQIDEAQAKAKIMEIMNAENATSDYIFATPGLDVRMLGRIDGWVSQVESKDKFTDQMHAVKVAEYASALAKQAGMPKTDIDMVRLAALVHDVGKLAIPQEILQKSDEELSDDELILVMKHPLDGAQLIESFPELAHIAPIVRSHQEEFDGNGYPAGLRGEAIPLASRIIRIADAYHALTCKLTYREAKPPQVAQMEITKAAGSQFDPRLVEAFLLYIMQQGQ